MQQVNLWQTSFLLVEISCKFRGVSEKLNLHFLSEFQVTLNEAGNVVVSWYNIEFDRYWVDIAAVANRGTYTVPEFCPVSKAYTLCEYEVGVWFV